MRTARRLDPRAAAQYRAQTARPVGDLPRLRQHQVAQCLLCQAWAFQLARRLCPSLSVLLQVKPSTGEPDAGDPHVRFGGRGSRTQSALPTPIRTADRGMTQKRPCVYILASRRNGTLYVGVTSDLPRRVWEHRSTAVGVFVQNA